MSLTPLSLQNSFLMISKKLQPDPARRGRQFESAIIRLTEWWHNEFNVDSNLAKNIHSRTFAEVQQELRMKGWIPEQTQGIAPETKVDRKGKGKAKAIELDKEEGGEIIRSSKSLMKHALMLRGSRDTSAQLFTALCRALSIPARLVVSIQAVPWKSSVGKQAGTKSRKDVKGKGKQESDGISSEHHFTEEDDDSDFEPVVMPPSSSNKKSASGADKGKNRELGQNANDRFPGAGHSLGGELRNKKHDDAKPPRAINLRKSKPQGNRLGTFRHHQHHDHPPIGGWPPVFWTEVFSKPDGKWIPVDPIRNLVNKKRLFQPPPNDRNNRLLYVFGFEEDGFGRDVTPRYAKEFGAKIAKLRPAGTKGRRDWWDNICGILARPYRLNRDDMEDAELVTNQISEGMPTSVQGFKDHPLYILERHLKRDEVIHPRVEIGKFRGESVFSRSNLVQLKTSENWMRQGREVKEGNQPLKWVKVRAVTVSKQRAVEMASEGGESVLQGLYADWQTKTYIPPPIVDGKVPKNDFGNIDLYVPSMLPVGGVHLPFKGIAKVARKLGIDYAEAVVGFEFKKRKALPILDGVVIPREHESTVLEAYLEMAQAVEEKERQKKQARVMQRWKRLVTGLRIRERLAKQYSNSTALTAVTASKPNENPEATQDISEGGGFLLNEHDTNVVQPYSLPKPQHFVPSVLVGGPTKNDDNLVGEVEDSPIIYESFGESDEEGSDGMDPMDGFGVLALEGRSTDRLAPKTMVELAEEAEVRKTSSEEEILTNTGGNGKRITRSVARPTEDIGSPQSVHGTTVSSTHARRSVTRKTTRSAPTPKRTRRPNEKRRRPASSASSAASSEEGSDESSLTDEEDSQRTPAKRQRLATNLETKGSEPISSGRTLRPRKGKTEEQLREEKERERAFKRAIAE
ncbi:hypothetical protein FRC03_011977 [Tulasnella sp. 419]|nr:hypothetical protein FRC03_011977 [Tulasnella sp. 419]